MIFQFTLSSSHLLLLKIIAERNIKSNPSIHILEKIAEGLDVPLLTILSENKTAENIDSEWLSLLKKAIDTGLTKDQFEEFITIRMLKK